LVCEDADFRKLDDQGKNQALQITAFPPDHDLLVEDCGISKDRVIAIQPPPQPGVRTFSEYDFESDFVRKLRLNAKFPNPPQVEVRRVNRLKAHWIYLCCFPGLFDRYSGWDFYYRVDCKRLLGPPVNEVRRGILGGIDGFLGSCKSASMNVLTPKITTSSPLIVTARGCVVWSRFVRMWG
jgi:hypothetical protein